MNNEINTFNEIIKESSTAENYLDRCLPLLFQTYEMNYTKYICKSAPQKKYFNYYVPNVIIVDRRKLDSALENFINDAKSFYESDKNFNNSSNPTKYLISNTLQNTLLDEFDDIRNLFNRYINFFKNERLQDYMEPKNIGYSELLCGSIVIGIAKESIETTSPLSFHISIERIINDKLFYYDFPCIRYGISSSKAYIFEIEKVEERKTNNNDEEYKKELKMYQKSIDALITKAINNKEVVAKEIFVLTAFIALLEKRGIKEIIVPTVLINRFNSLEIYCLEKLSQLNTSYEEASIKGDTKILQQSLSKMSIIKDMLEKHQKTIENKNTSLIKNFSLIESIFSNYKIYDYPMQKDTNLHFHIIEEGNKCNNKLLKELTFLLNRYEDTNNILKGMK